MNQRGGKRIHGDDCENHPPEEAARRADATLKRLLNTPPKPQHQRGNVAPAHKLPSDERGKSSKPGT